MKRLRYLLLIPVLGAFLYFAKACASYGPSEAGKGTAAYDEAPSIVNEAPVPDNWPALTPVDEIRVKQYPAYRAAFIVADQDKGGSDNGLFRPLFNHINREDIAMTSPVEMTYDQEGDADSMAFLYRTTDMGKLGPDADDPRIKVRDVPAMTVLSVGVKGDYTHERFEQYVKQLNAWLADHKSYRAVGEPRYLGYNSPFVFPASRRYGEVQVPIQPVN